MKILVINAGSSSLKMQLFESESEKCLFKDIIDRIGLDKGSRDYSTHATHAAALNYGLKKLITKKIIKKLAEIKAVGHRVVHGGEKYSNPVKINTKVLAEIKKLCTLAPLHNPPNLAAILACQKLLPGVPQVAVFDTAFHQTMPEKAYLYALPYDYYQKNKIRRYGFHGTSHSYVAKETIKLLKKNATTSAGPRVALAKRGKSSKIVTCHLGNGASVTAVLNGKSVDTSMGFTPLEGLPMGTRCGDLDPAIIFELIKITKLAPTEVENILNKNSGLKGISGLSSDMRDLWEACDQKINALTKSAGQEKQTRSALALQIYCYKIAKYIGSYAAAMNGLDAITFTAGIGENAWYIREAVCDYLTFLGAKIDPTKNKKNQTEISTKSSKIKVFVIPTNEEMEIARQTKFIINNP